MKRFILALLLLAGPAMAQSPTPTPTPPLDDEAVGYVLTPTPTRTWTPARDEKVTTYRLQRSEVKVVSVTAAQLKEVCLGWPVPGTPTALGTDYAVTCTVEDVASSAAAVQLHHVRTIDANQVCVDVFNRDPLAAHDVAVYCLGYRWGTTN